MKLQTKNSASGIKSSAIRAASSESGFTLIETAIALVIMMVVGLGAASLFFFAASNNLGANDRELSMAVAQKRMEWLRNIPLNDTTKDTAYAYPNGGLKATAQPLVETVKIDGGPCTVTEGGRCYRITTTITDLDTDSDNTADSNAIPPTIKIITIRVTPFGSGPQFNQGTSVFGSVTLTTQRTLNRVGPHRS